MTWLYYWVEQIALVFYQVFTTPLIDLGGNRVSLSTLFILLALAVAVFWGARLLSQSIKRSLLSRLGIDRGTQEAIATVLSYLLMALGLSVVLQTAGFNLSSLAVVASVLGIGIGFGLQNLTSNFISGITLLVERPIKVGDFIEVEALMGTVEKISIRSTVVRTIDGVCVIIPNQHFIENKIINWSYQDPTSCLRIPIGVHYGTDPVLVTEALLAAARMEPRILSSPSPRVWLVNFGDNALNFELLIWFNDPPAREAIKSSLNFRIEHEFRERQIEIPFPQRELRIANLQELQRVFQPQANAISNSTRIPEPSTSAIEAPSLVSPIPQRWDLRVLLRRMIYFEQCSDLELRSLIEQGYRQLFGAGDVICRELDPGESFYLILSGSVEVYSQRSEKYIATLHAGEFFGEIALLTGSPRSASVRALEDTTLFVIERQDLQQLLHQHRNLAEQIAYKLSERQQVLQELGILDEGALRRMGETPLSWIRKRIQTIFGI